MVTVPGTVGRRCSHAAYALMGMDVPVEGLCGLDGEPQLARCLRDIPDVRAAFATYEQLRRDRVEKVAAQAARTNSQAPVPSRR